MIEREAAKRKKLAIWRGKAAYDKHSITSSLPVRGDPEEDHGKRSED